MKIYETCWNQQVENPCFTRDWWLQCGGGERLFPCRFPLCVSIVCARKIRKIGQEKNTNKPPPKKYSLKSGISGGWTSWTGKHKPPVGGLVCRVFFHFKQLTENILGFMVTRWIVKKKMPIIGNMFFEKTQASRKHWKPSQADAQLATVPPSRRRGCEPNETRGSFSWAKARRFWSWKIMVSSLDLSYNIWNSEAEILFWRWSSISHWTCSTPGPSFSFEDVLMQIELRSWDTTPAVLRHLN